MRIHRPDRLLDPIVKRVEAVVLPIGGLVDGVVPRDPSVVFVVLRQSVSRRPRVIQTLQEAGTGVMDP